MATFEYDGVPIYYEDHGAGEPLLILGGIFMSCASWAAFLPAFTAHNRLLLLDLVDQGQSGKVDHDYSQQLQILTTKINQMTEATQMISNMLKSLHDMAEGIIANMK